jgi:CRISPR-associated protein Cas2
VCSSDLATSGATWTGTPVFYGGDAMMLVVVAYDVSTETPEGKKRLREVAKLCENVGQRVQNSVFECLVDASQWTLLRARLVGAASAVEDSLRFYFLGDNWRHRVEHVGAKTAYDPQGPLVL